MRAMVMMSKTIYLYLVSNFSTKDIAVEEIEQGKEGVIIQAPCYMAHEIKLSSSRALYTQK